MLASGPQVGGPGVEAVVEDPLGAVGGVREELAFRCPTCQRCFSTKTGLGVHRTKKHPVEVNEGAIAVLSKRRWSREETDLLARKEAELVVAGSSHINEELSQAFPRRTLDAIKSRRRGQPHSDAVLEYVAEIRTTQNRTTQNRLEDQRQFRPTAEVLTDEEQGEEGKRWTLEEEDRLARREAELVRTGCRHLNQGLLGFLPRRTLDAIKCKRRFRSYQNRVAGYLEEIQTPIVEDLTQQEIIMEDQVREQSSRAQGREIGERQFREGRIDMEREQSSYARGEVSGVRQDGEGRGEESQEGRRGVIREGRIENVRRNPRRRVRQDGESQVSEDYGESQVGGDQDGARLPVGILNFLEEQINDDLEIAVALLEEEVGETMQGLLGVDDQIPTGNEGRYDPMEAIKGELRTCITQEPPITHQGAKLFGIVRDYLRGRDIRLALDSYLDEVFPPPKEKARRRPANVREVQGSRRNRRKAEYAKMQDLYQKNRGRCAEEIFGIGSKVNPFSVRQFEEEWGPVFGLDGGNKGRTKGEKQDAKREIWSPITSQELRNHRMVQETAPGPDGIKVEELKAVPAIILRIIFNIILAIGALPVRMNRSRTIFIPKVEEPASPADYRPISITSVLTRQLHKILAARLDYHLDWDERQRGFIRADGCAENILLVSTIIRDAHEKKKELHIMSMDIKKAFDSGTYGGIQDDLCEISCPEEFLSYMRNIQDTATTCIEIEGDTSGEITIKRGVRQGDPMSPKIFSAVIDRLLKRFPRTIGYNLDGVMINCGAFADDLLLFSSTVEGMQHLVKIAEEELNPKGLQFHPGKCTSISLIPDGKRKRMNVLTVPTFKVAGEFVSTTTVEGSFKYLGIRMTPTGVILYDNQKLEDNLTRLKAAPLKPQQRLCLLRDHLMPKYHHQLVFANLGAGRLNMIDIQIRKAVREWLFLPHDVPTAFFHAAGRDGGLGIPSLRWMIPRLTSERLKSLKNSEIEVFQAMSRHASFTKQEKKAETLLMDRGRIYNSKASQQERWSTLLYASVDGGGLREASGVPAAHHWMRDGTRLISGRDFLQAIKLRIGALPTRARTTRGRIEDANCRAGCRAKETIQHLLQCCPRTHGTRVKRHDGVVKLLKSQLERRGHQVVLEPHFRTEEGLRKPDLMVTSEGEVSIIDVQVTQDDKPLEDLHKRKTRYYANNISLLEQVQERSARRNILFSSFTITWRGVVCKSSAEFVKRLGIRTNDIKMLALRTVQGSLLEWSTFNRMTEREAHPTGVG